MVSFVVFVWCFCLLRSSLLYSTASVKSFVLFVVFACHVWFVLLLFVLCVLFWGVLTCVGAAVLMLRGLCVVCACLFYACSLFCLFSLVRLMLVFDCLVCCVCGVCLCLFCVICLWVGVVVCFVGLVCVFV